MQEVLLALKIASRFIPAARRLIKGLRKDSPGGKRLTPGEKKKIREALLPVIDDMIDDIIEE